MKQAVVIYDVYGLPVQVAEVKSFDTTKDFLNYKTQIEERTKQVESETDKKIAELENRIFKLETELKYNRGEISEEEFNELCGNK